MRIISGKHGGRKLKSFDGDEVRPTSDRAKEALFNILGNIGGKAFLDLYSGTGAIAIEALSRGAYPVTLVDAADKSVAIERANLKAIGETANVVKSRAKDFLRRANDKYDIIFLDPPYIETVDDVLGLIAEKRALKDGGVIVYEHSGEKTIEVEGLRLKDKRKYGIAVFDFYEYAE